MKTIQISGVIISNDYEEIYEWLGWESTCPKNVQKELNEANGDSVSVTINSPGG